MKIIIILLFLLEQAVLPGQKIHSENLNRLIDYCNDSKADEIILSTRDKIISHWTRSDYTNLQIDSNLSLCQTPFMGTASMVKSWTGLLIGILIDQQYIKQVDDLVCDYLPEWEIGCQNKITIRHLLTMTGGYSRLGSKGILSQSDMHEFALQLQPDTLPGIRFSYSNESVQILGILAEKVTQLQGDDLFGKFILGPLEMDSTSFSRDSTGHFIYFGGCKTTAKNALKIGQLMLRKGNWNEMQIVSEQWVKESTTPSPLAPYYGYLWWIDRNSKYWNFAATGDLGQMTIVFPELDLVFVRKQSCDLSPSSKKMSWMGPKFLELISDTVEK